MKRNSKEISKESFKYHKKVANFHFKPLPRHLPPFNGFYILSYIATLELEKLITSKGKFATIDHIETSPFSILKK